MNAITILEPESLDYLPAATLLRLVERQQKAAKNLKAFKATVTAMPDLFRKFEEMDISPDFSLDEGDYIGLRFTGDGPKLTEVWKAMRLAGYNTSTRPAKGDTSFYAFWDKEGHVRIFMNFSSSVCRRVKIGTKMVEQDIYETQCGELPEIEAPATAVVTTEAFDNDIPF